jgi:hypothetical protein
MITKLKSFFSAIIRLIQEARATEQALYTSRDYIAELQAENAALIQHAIGSKIDAFQAICDAVGAQDNFSRARIIVQAQHELLMVAAPAAGLVSFSDDGEDEINDLVASLAAGIADFGDLEVIDTFSGK